jgi:hypothetical protein
VSEVSNNSTSLEDISGLAMARQGEGDEPCDYGCVTGSDGCTCYYFYSYYRDYKG